ncbi:Zn(2)-C6 fungal-type DNA-binding domain protein [Cordyceps fumosorosea ARSEF 2679]|uniref:Zn(2)-C6 fungal-type DNA-binding domain protein n=1 Tax=Cordyceps fumosorosea (strain ARSEF 2679) TaxID=1081104 RepID=A0A167V1U8_CORFA|nr:Zn(2)-C6 fungal-type DNA-binding domain protein [Cordyceps fumosorosea ARSEF 2679]OAA62135.1 Zn(2)-C6 fungal-type DNA-binding domain protein [Cordyceps fumosorosea ARSEF 2679]
MSAIRSLLSGKVRSQSGCYTCRLRRKKCDERRPVCDGCAALEITCFYGEQKPDWMDGGPRQRAMAETIKSQVKKQASQRRDRKYLEMLESGTRMVNLNDEPPAATNGDHSSDTPAVFASESDRAFDTSPSSISATTGPSPDMPWHHHQLAGPGPERKSDYDSAQDTHLIMNYVDFVFPYLFPYYQPPILPPILVGGRGWVLDAFLHGSRAIYYTAIALSSWFFGVLLAGGEEKHAACTERMARQLHHQMGISLKELQKNVQAISAKRGGGDGTSCAREALEVMQSVIQMLIFEVTAANKDNWKMHLDAAMALFAQILPRPGGWTETLHALWTPKWPPPEMGIRRPWSTDQAALRFFGANLLYIDVMASITMSRRPRLAAYHDSVIPIGDDGGGGPGGDAPPLSTQPQSAGPLRMEEFFGLQNWVVRTLGDIAALDADKKAAAARAAGEGMTATELSARGEPLLRAVRAGIRHLDEQDYAQTPVERAVSVIRDPLSSLNPTAATAAAKRPQFVIQNLIWLHAAFLYLDAVVSGWRPADAEVRRSVDKVTELLVGLPDGKTMQSMAFPFCVAGCLAAREELRERYRALVGRLGPLRVFGTMQEARNIMERTWAAGAEGEDWDVARCLNILGHGALLI